MEFHVVFWQSDRFCLKTYPTLAAARAAAKRISRSSMDTFVSYGTGRFVQKEASGCFLNGEET